MDTFYWYPGACSFAVHAVLEETGHPYEARKIDIHGGDNDTPEYRAIHPRGLVPVLQTEAGLLTEAPAILLHLADSHPEANLVPKPGTIERTRCHEWLLYGATYPHPIFSRVMRAERFVADPGAKDSVRNKAQEEFWEALQLTDRKLDGRRFALGNAYSICDPYLTVFWFWGRFVGLPVGDLAAYSKLAARVLERPAVRKAVSDEQLPIAL
ncbi:MAG: glutathione S-transferase N-terminal domain-containing protein [Thermodesulfobacteriota bacterium]